MTPSEKNFEALKALRHWLHAHPELSGQEYETSRKIIETLKTYQPDEIITEIGGTGVAAIYNGKAPGKTVMIRAELDGLPIHEVNTDLAYRSLYDGRGHKCGHDGHMAIVMGLAQIYAQQRPAQGRVVLLFQPAEENGAGGRAVCADEKFKALGIEYAFALHNLPEYPRGTIVCKAGSFSASVESLRITFSGETAHAAEPGKAISPAVILPQILQRLEIYNQAPREAEDFQRASLTHLHMGEEGAYGITAGNAVLELTLRARTPEKLAALKADIQGFIQEHAAAYSTQLGVRFEIREPFAANMNDADAVALVEQAAGDLGLDYETRAVPNDWGEDFGIFTNLPHVKAAMFGLGSDTYNLHHPAYDFPDEIIRPGVDMFAQIIARLARVSSS